ncbi:hypothetical protein B0H14DRAFT_2583262 [Mycena olivaceomarginata]|nr:hypothetical protein B0H14DRAFT_2583262 [Mycena olivaceomarginata]
MNSTESQCWNYWRLLGIGGSGEITDRKILQHIQMRMRATKRPVCKTSETTAGCHLELTAGRQLVLAPAWGHCPDFLDSAADSLSTLCRYTAYAGRSGCDCIRACLVNLRDVEYLTSVDYAAPLKLNSAPPPTSLSAHVESDGCISNRHGGNQSTRNGSTGTTVSESLPASGEYPGESRHSAAFSVGASALVAEAGEGCSRLVAMFFLKALLSELERNHRRMPGLPCASSVCKHAVNVNVKFVKPRRDHQTHHCSGPGQGIFFGAGNTDGRYFDSGLRSINAVRPMLWFRKQSM